MARYIAPIQTATDTFAGWISKTNLILDTLANEVITVDNTTYGASVTGNGSVTGILAANTIGANLIRGGGVGNTANVSSITVGFSNSTTSSNVTVTGYTTNVNSNSLNITSNTTVGTGTQRLTANIANLQISTNTLTIQATSNINVNTSLTLTGNLTINSHITFSQKINVSTNFISLVFPNTTQQNTVDTFSVSDYSGAQYNISITDENNSNNKALTQISVIYGFSNAHLTEYGTIYSNTQFITFTITSNTTHVILNANSATSNATFKVHRTAFV